MLELSFTGAVRRRPLQVLCLGAHCDDIDLGCGGALLALLRRYPGTRVTWVTFCSNKVRAREVRASAGRLLRGAASWDLRFMSHRDGFFPAAFAAIKEDFESLKGLTNPDLIFTHQRDDLHQDHRVVAELTWNTFRRHLVLEYEIPKYEGGLTTPSVYVALTRRDVERKVRTLLSCYETQRSRSWFTAETIRGLLRLRGIESGSPSGWAEGFHSRKLLVG